MKRTLTISALVALALAVFAMSTLLPKLGGPEAVDYSGHFQR